MHSVRMMNVHVMGQKETDISELCKELGITKPILYRYLAPNGALSDYGKMVLDVEQ